MNAYHNLAGFLRDLRAVLTDEGFPLADSYYWQLRDLLEELVKEASDGTDDDVTDADELESSDGDDDLAVSGPGNGGHPGEVRRGHDARRTRKVGGSAAVADVLPRDVPPARSRGRGRAPVVTRTGKGVKRRGKK